jgi:AcrR family transcriptional regulator
MADFTKKAIKETFMRLLNQKPLSKITVKEIASECGINRNTFYYHYSDIPTLLETILIGEAERLVLSKTPSGSLYEHIIFAVDFAIENKAAIYHIYNSASREIFEQYLERIARKGVAGYMEASNKTVNISPDDKEVIVLYYKCLVIGFVIDWLGVGMKYDLRKKLFRIFDLFDGAMDNAIAICERENNINT